MKQLLQYIAIFLLAAFLMQLGGVVLKKNIDQKALEEYVEDEIGAEDDANEDDAHDFVWTFCPFAEPVIIGERETTKQASVVDTPFPKNTLSLGIYILYRKLLL